MMEAIPINISKVGPTKNGLSGTYKMDYFGSTQDGKLSYVLTAPNGNQVRVDNVTRKEAYEIANDIASAYNRFSEYN